MHTSDPASVLRLRLLSTSIADLPEDHSDEISLAPQAVTSPS